VGVAYLVLMWVCGQWKRAEEACMVDRLEFIRWCAFESLGNQAIGRVPQLLARCKIEGPGLWNQIFSTPLKNKLVSYSIRRDQGEGAEQSQPQQVLNSGQQSESKLLFVGLSQSEGF
jgi:hypothetical protein